MKKRKGFTLIELLAVIVILAIIALIAVPIALNIINESRKGAFARTAEGVLKSSKLTYQSKLLDSIDSRDLFYHCDKTTNKCVSDKLDINGNNLELDVTGSVGEGDVYVYANGSIALSLTNGKYCAVKYAESKTITVSEGNCSDIDVSSDTTPPEFNTESSASYIVTTNSAVVTVRAYDEQSTIKGYSFKIDDGEFGSIQGSNAIEYTNLEPGSTHTVIFRVYNKTPDKTTYVEAENMAESSITFTLNSIVTPIISISPSTYASNTNTDKATLVKVITIDYTGGDSNAIMEGITSGYEIYSNANPTTPIATGTDTTILLDQNNVTIKAYNQDNNNNKVQPIGLSISNIDTSAPTDVDFTSTRDENGLVITATATDAQSGIYGFEFSLDNGSTWSAMQTTGTTSTTAQEKVYTYNTSAGYLVDATYEIKVRATNNAYYNTATDYKTGKESQGITTSIMKRAVREFDVGETIFWGDKRWHIVGKGDYPVPNAEGTDNSGTARGYVLLLDDTNLTKVAHCNSSSNTSSNNCYMEGASYYTYRWNVSQIRSTLVDTSTGYPQDVTFNSLRNEMIPTLICNDPALVTNSTNKTVTYGGSTKYEIDQFEDGTCASGYSKDYVRLLTVSEYYNLSYRTSALSTAFKRTSTPYLPIAVIEYMPTKIASTNTWFYPSSITYMQTSNAYSGTSSVDVKYTALLYNSSSYVNYATGDSASYIYIPVVVVKADSSIRAASKYTVTFESNGGSSVATQTIIEQDKVKKPTDPTRTGYNFNGWYADSSLTTAYNFSTVVTSDITLYAKWTRKTCQEIFNGVKTTCQNSASNAASACANGCAQASGCNPTTACANVGTTAYNSCMSSDSTKNTFNSNASANNLTCNYSSFYP